MTLDALNTNAERYNSKDDYLCFAEVSLCGLLLLGFCKSSLKFKISKIATTKIKQGLGGKTGNKGACIVRFNLDNTSIIVTNAHLESGQKQLYERLFQFKEITSNKLSGKRNQNYDYQSHIVKVFMGDLNFRLDLDYEMAKVASINFNEDDKMLLQKADQLLKCFQTEAYMEEITEGPLNFRPTYKYDNLSDSYDTSKKQRTPSW
jgi:synaptojanin